MQRGFLGIALAAMLASGGPASAQTSLKVILPFSFQGALSNWTLSAADGCYKKQGLDVTLQAAAGSGDALGKLAAGAYDIGIVDFTSLVLFDAQQPDHRLISTYVMIDRAPTSVVGLKSRGIAAPKDLVGKRIGDAAGEASRVLFPAFAKVNGIDPASVSWVTVAPNLRASSLARGDDDAAAGAIWAITSGLQTIGVKDADVTVLAYAEWGVDLFGNSVAAKPAWLASHGDAMKAFLACAVDGMKGAIADPAAAVASLKPFSSLVDENQALLELNFSNKFSIRTPNVLENGLSAVSPDRLDRVLTQVSQALKLTKPAAADLWTADYLPPQKARMLAPH